jgi:hypothetical protein
MCTALRRTAKRCRPSVFPEILGQIFFLRTLMGSHFPLVGIRGVFYALHHFSLESVAFLEQFVDAFRIGALNIRQSLQSPRLPAGFRTQTFRFQIYGFNALPFSA